MDPVPEAPVSLEFGRFRVLPHRRELLADGRPVKLGGRGFDVLMALIEGRGTVLGKDALMARVWPNRVVEEKNLHAQISALRTALGAERELIRTVPGRGYQFTGEKVRFASDSPLEGAGFELPVPRGSRDGAVLHGIASIRSASDGMTMVVVTHEMSFARGSSSWMPASSSRKASPTSCSSRRGPSACVPFSSAITIAIGSEQRLAARALAQVAELWSGRTELTTR